MNGSWTYWKILPSPSEKNLPLTTLFVITDFLHIWKSNLTFFVSNHFTIGSYIRVSGDVVAVCWVLHTFTILLHSLFLDVSPWEISVSTLPLARRKGKTPKVIAFYVIFLFHRASWYSKASCFVSGKNRVSQKPCITRFVKMLSNPHKILKNFKFNSDFFKKSV